MTKVIAISGWKQSGKDTFADYVCDSTDNFAKRYAFAGVLKDMVAEQYNIPRESCDHPEMKESPLDQYPVNPQDDFSKLVCEFMKGEFKNRVPFGPKYWTPRALCILEGSIKRSVNSSYWVQRIVDSVNNDKAGFHKVAVITDLRYNSELGQLRDAFGDDLVTVRVNRFDDSPSTDPSERDLDNSAFDHKISNKGTLSQYHCAINDVLSKVLRGNETIGI